MSSYERLREVVIVSSLCIKILYNGFYTQIRTEPNLDSRNIVGNVRKVLGDLMSFNYCFLPLING